MRRKISVTFGHLRKNGTNKGSSYDRLYVYIEGEGTVGYHKAPIPQLFIVVEGEGWVTGENQKRIPIKRGEAALWEKEEWHTSGSETGMTAIVIQSEELHPETFMERKKHA
ncbi:cupin domain-containing protein [Priestia megaterium]|uniref:cupin domain-containing protein n=1 Tax=Priestia megaterium TaxID=1404 RepID=UPI002E2078F9|nr:cupin domain-containing protein [Priestia megaterium]